MQQVEVLDATTFRVADDFGDRYPSRSKCGMPNAECGIGSGREVDGSGVDPPSSTAVVNRLRQQHYGGQESTMAVRKALRRVRKALWRTGG